MLVLAIASLTQFHSPSSGSRLRLAAALAILKLAATPVYQTSIAERFELFARTAQVS